MEPYSIGFALCGSYCTYREAMDTLKIVTETYEQVTPIVSERASVTDTRFGLAKDFLVEMERLCQKRVVDSIVKAEPIGPQKLLDAMVICPCTGSTLAKLVTGMTDTSVTMAAKAHLRNGRPLVLAMATNDGLSGSAPNIATLLSRKNIYFVPFGQDDPQGKPNSLVADFTQVLPTLEAALEGRQLQPLLLQPSTTTS